MADSDGAVWIGSYGDGLFRCERGTATQLSMPAGKRIWRSLLCFKIAAERSGLEGMKACSRGREWPRPRRAIHRRQRKWMSAWPKIIQAVCTSG